MPHRVTAPELWALVLAGIFLGAAAFAVGMFAAVGRPDLALVAAAAVAVLMILAVALVARIVGRPDPGPAEEPWGRPYTPEFADESED